MILEISRDRIFVLLLRRILRRGSAHLLAEANEKTVTLEQLYFAASEESRDEFKSLTNRMRVHGENAGRSMAADDFKVWVIREVDRFRKAQKVAEGEQS